jgi:thiamine phosphate synthase YjbQ (UPF0047 family)
MVAGYQAKYGEIPVEESLRLLRVETLNEEDATVTIRGQGLHEFTQAVQDALLAAEIDEGLCTLFVRRTSASLLIQDDLDPSTKRDLQRLVESSGA